MEASPYTDLERPPLHAGALRRALVVPGGVWSDLVLKTETGSTNADVAQAARAGVAEGLVLTAERQVSGRGRLGRQWESPPRAGIAVSVLLRPGDVVPERVWPAASAVRYGWLPLLAGVALVETVRRLGEVDAVLKWPNDLLIDEYKCAGILAESVPDPRPAVVLGMGLNVSLRADELPHDKATSLALAGSACVDRDPLLRALLRELAAWYTRWREAGGDPEESGLREAYRTHCGTLGRTVRVSLPGGSELTGTASDVDTDGRLVITDEHDRPIPVSAGDVIHVR